MFLLPEVFAEDFRRYDGRRLDLRDERYIERCIPQFDFAFRYWFRVDVDGLDNLPRAGPAILAGNHNGGLQTPEAAITAYLWWRLRGAAAPAYALIHPAVFAVPYLNVHATKMGGVRAHPRTAMEVLDRGAVALVYPGGADDAYRTYDRRHEIELAGRKGFIKLAMRYRAPIVPVVAAGAHETFIVLHDGKELARRLRLDRLGIERLPITYSWPFGITVGGTYNIPFPTKIKLSFGEPIEVTSGRRGTADVDVVYDEIRSRMQRRMDELVGRYPDRSRGAERH
jgi:1-acyl-sn-glycerol-3-phosphate acyltransferase